MNTLSIQPVTKITLKKTILIAIACVLPFVAGIAQQPKEAQLAPIMQAKTQQIMPDAPLPMLPNPNWSLIRSAYGPTLPPGWTLIGAESVLQDGNSMNVWVMYMYKPSTRQTAGWLIQVQ